MCFWAPFNSRTSQCLSVTGIQVVAPICTCSELYSGLEYCWGWRLHNIFGQPIPMLGWWKSLSLCQVGAFLASICPFCVSSFCHAVLRRAWLHLLGNLLAGIEKLLLAPPKATSSPGWTSLPPSASPHPASALAPWPSWWPFSELTLLYQHLSHTGRPKTGCSILNAVFSMQSKPCWVKGDNHF